MERGVLRELFSPVDQNTFRSDVCCHLIELPLVGRALMTASVYFEEMSVSAQLQTLCVVKLETDRYLYLLHPSKQSQASCFSASSLLLS